MSAPAGSRARLLAIAVALLALAAIGWRLAWLGDDAYITLRSVENWASGHGLRWNPGDRVQTYTHPLWMLLLSLGRLVSGEVYFTTIAVSLGVSVLACALLLRRAGTWPAVVAVATLLVAVRAFGDYMTSGLETPLTFLLLALFVPVVVADADGEAQRTRRYSRAVLLASLMASNRMDLALLCLPPVLATMPGVPLRALLLRGLLGAAPFALWLLFAGVYYGSPFPVTAHAKAFGVGIPAGELAVQGLRYLLHAVVHDPALLPTILASALLLLLPFGGRARWVAVGALCYVAYVVKVGGGFMQGRFLLPPFVALVAAAGPRLGAMPPRVPAAVASVAFVLMWFGGVPNFALPPSDDQPLTLATIELQHGIADERRMYYRELGLLAPTRRVPEFGALEQVAFPGGRDEPWLLLNGAVGSAGFGAGAEGHVVDPLLCDPRVARLPAKDPSDWRIGHVLRRIPEGYYETLATGENRLHHDGLRRYYEALRTLTTADVFDGARLSVLWQMARGAFDADLRAFVEEQYYAPPRITRAAASLPKDAPPGAFWFDEPRAQLVYEGGVAVTFDAARSGSGVAIEVFHGAFFRYRVRFVRDGEVVGEGHLAPLPLPAGLQPMQYAAGLLPHALAVPQGTGAFDALWIDFENTPESHKTPGPPGFAGVTVQP